MLITTWLLKENSCKKTLRKKLNSLFMIKFNAHFTFRDEKQPVK
jgi:hypothetical protein